MLEPGLATTFSVSKSITIILLLIDFDLSVIFLEISANIDFYYKNSNFLARFILISSFLTINMTNWAKKDSHFDT